MRGRKRFSKETLEKAKEARKVTKLFENKNYLVEKIFLNLRITIKVPKRKRGFNSMDRDLYLDENSSLEEAKEWAEDYIGRYFIK